MAFLARGERKTREPGSGLKIGRRFWVAFLLAAVAATLSVLGWPPERFDSKAFNGIAGPLHNLERWGYDALFATLGPRRDKIDPRIVVVGIDNSDEADLRSNWPFPRKIDAAVIRNLAQDGAKVIACDILFDGPGTSKEDDQALQKALKEAGNVVLTSRLDHGTAMVPRKALDEPYHDSKELADPTHIDFLDSATCGFAEVMRDPDGITSAFVPVQYFEDDLLPSFPTAVYMRLNGIDAKQLRVTESSILVGKLAIPRTGPTAGDLFDNKPIPSVRVAYPQGAAAFKMPAKFSQVAEISSKDVQSGRFSRGTFRDKIVFVGLTGSQLIQASGEQFITSYSRLHPDQVAGDVVTPIVPGVVLQALHFNALLQRTFVRETTGSAIWSLVFLMTMTAVSLIRRFPNLLGLLAVVSCGFIQFGFSLLSLRIADLHVPYVIPTICMFSCAAAVGWLESGSIKRKWAGYVSPAVLNQILQSEEGIGAKQYDASVMFGDIRGFTSFSERHAPEKVVYLLNRHLEKMTAIISKENGTIDKFLGDGILAVFGAPIVFEGSAVAAVRAAWDMKRAASEPILDEEGVAHTLWTGFGITTGTFLGGDIGSKQLRNWTIIGDTVNLASRLQGVTGESDVILDEPTFELVKSHVRVESLGAVTLKGKAQPVPCFRVTEWLG